MKLIIALTLFLVTTIVQAQSSTQQWPAHELAVNVDNDYPFMTDQYYTGGQDFYYRFLLNGKKPIFQTNDSVKTIFTLHYGVKIFNPKNVDTKDTQYMDRPYCGWNFISAELRNFRRKNSSNFFALQMGLVGTESGMGQLQQWIHKTIHLYGIEGWDSQIKNEFVVNANVSHTHGFSLGKKADLVSSSSAWLGTGSNKISQEFTIRLLRFNALNQSTFLNANLSSGEEKDSKGEFFFFASLAGDVVLSNIFIQGSLFKDNPSTYTTSLNTFFLSQKLGVTYSSRRISLTGMVVHLTKETKLVSFHNYASAALAYRF